MIDSASVVAIADQVKTTLDQGKVLVDAWSVVIVSIIGLVAYVLGILSGKKSEPAKKEGTIRMVTEADTLVIQFPDRTGQLRGPVYDYLKRGAPYTKVPQDLYMQVFYPKARKWSPDTEFPEYVQKVNPGIKTVGDYVRKVEAPRKKPVLSAQEEEALRIVAADLGTARDTLYNLINFESGWDPAARNPYSGARGLIQFMPSTARWMGFGKSLSLITVLFALGALYFIGRKYNLF